MAKANKKGDPDPNRVVCSNPKARQKFEIEEKIEAGILLSGSEVKSLRNRHANLEGAYAMIERDELWLNGMHIGAYEYATAYGHELRRPRKLLVHRREIERLRGQTSIRGYTLVPMQVYFHKGWAKIQLGLGKAKGQTDRREELKKRADQRETEAAIKKHLQKS